MSNIQSEIRKNAEDCNQLFKIAEGLRKQAAKIEEEAGKICENNPSVFIEETKNKSLAIYISTENLVPTISGYHSIETIGPYEDFLVIVIDEYAFKDLVTAVHERF